MQDLTTGKEYPAAQYLPHWSPQLQKILENLSWSEQWNLLYQNYRIKEEHILNREEVFRREGKGVFALTKKIS